MKILTQSGNSVAEYKRTYIVDVTDRYNKKWSNIEGELLNSNEKFILGKYKDHDQAQQILKLLLLEPNIFTMPPETFEEDENFLYPTVD